LGDFDRSFILSDDIDRSLVSAELKHGVLRVWLPRAERSVTRRIDVRGE
jgi:HSP20 family molecular chaperone IbpA